MFWTVQLLYCFAGIGMGTCRALINEPYSSVLIVAPTSVTIFPAELSVLFLEQHLLVPRWDIGGRDVWQKEFAYFPTGYLY